MYIEAYLSSLVPPWSSVTITLSSFTHTSLLPCNESSCQDYTMSKQAIAHYMVLTHDTPHLERETSGL